MSTVCYTFLLKKGTPYETKKTINRYIHRSNNTLLFMFRKQQETRKRYELC